MAVLNFRKVLNVVLDLQYLAYRLVPLGGEMTVIIKIFILDQQN